MGGITMDSTKFVFPRKGMMLTTKLLDRFFWTMAAISLFVGIGAALNFLLGGEVKTFTRAILLFEALAAILAGMTAMYLKRKLIKVYAAEAGENAFWYYDSIWRCHMGDIGLLGIVVAVALSVTNYYVCVRIFP